MGNQGIQETGLNKEALIIHHQSNVINQSYDSKTKYFSDPWQWHCISYILYQHVHVCV